ncbi:DNA-directed RNA polymerase subunit [Quillaja saponaria]|uniref:DNA-directed RNA polymerase subunit n=1 Tax=Quillaja saponaria TaxID=32244 RepID=A0AAD7Q8Q2_QUISA|nr:DNA-directed RNA polymerase subunit [Quillaja saponaria]
MEVASESVEAVGFSFLTSEEVLKHSFVKITNPILLDSIGRPVPGGLYDPALGPLDEKAPCKSCGQPSKICPGHCGHIDLVYPTYNPLLFNILHKILQKTCFFCYKFRANRIEVETCTSQLELIMKGDIVGAKMLDPDNPNESTCEKNADDFQYHSAEELQQKWTSLQFTEAMDVINKFLRAKMKKCGNCKRKNPQISKPTFGWFYMNQMRDQQARENVIRGSTLDDANSLNESDGAERDTTSPASGVTEVSDIKGPNIGEELSLQFLKQKSFSGTLLPSEVKDIIKLLWENEVRLCSLISDIQGQGLGDRAGHTMFFLETILVPPIKFRPPTKGGDSVMEHPQTVSLTKVLQSNISLGNAHVNNLDRTKIVGRWRDLQQSINMLFDNKTASGQRVVAPGTIQLLEKKEGMFRQKMMGKRVNFACRSVISPDPYLAVNEIGIPPYFALRLTYPERVTPSNVVQLRDAVRNGPDLHPGATHYADKVSIVRLPPNQKKRNAISKTLSSSKGVVMRHGKICDYETEGKIVYRHLKDGDVVLVNRQPTLHKPSIMAHIVRVLKGEKTVRMHYANCSTYNADFDGDEMNVHFPQDEISRAEAYHIVNANNQYVKPTSGEPIRALIQDHIVSAALLTKKDTFLSHDEFNQLLYSSGVSSTGLGSFCGKPGQQVFISNSEDEIFSLPPAIWKPEPLWTGKQVISALLYYITRGCPPFSVEKSAKIPRDFFKNKDGEQNHSSQGILTKSEEADEDNVLIYKNDLVRGVVDKAQFGDYGMVHTVQELYGSDIAGNLLSALSRLFTAFLQMHGFTCGIDDLLLMERKDSERKKQLEKCEEIGENVHREFVEVMEHEEIDPITLQMNIEKRIRNSGEAALTYLDRKMISGLNSRTSSGFFKELLVEGILKPTGKNCISLMTTSGAKGSSVNFQQISSYLGQQELEGKRVPRMVSGKTLPCFPPWDSSPRAGGFIIDRFLTGLHPQEYYFHCMAGREGLVDTAVKTSRSGYLQRCLIKNLECLKICYDHTVRDADGSIIQFQYGEDGVDVHQTSFITKFEALATNQEMIYNGCRRQLDKSSPYVQKLPFALEEKAEKFMHDFSSKQRIPLIKKRDFLKLIEHKYLSSLAQPGEPVGVLAAQSVGEPSTQMTLNTFHLAGRGEMNVTLGIPRLQEILMTASNDIKTPVMTCPLQEGRSMDDATRLADKLKKITVADIIESMKVSVVPVAVDNHKIVRIYKLEMKLYKPKHYPKYTNISDADWKRTLEFKFVRKLEDAIQKHVELLSNICGIKNFIPNKQSKFSSVEDDVSTDRSEPEVRDANDDEGNEDTEEGEDLGLDAQKRKQQDSDEVDYDEDSEVELTTSELNDGELPDAFEREVDRAESETNSSEDDVNEVLDPDDVESPSAFTKASESIDGENKRKSIEEKKPEAELEKKENDRRILVKSQGMDFVIHFQFTNEPHFLLAQLAQRTAKTVCIQSFGKVDECRAVTCKENQIIYYGKDPRSRDDIPSSVKEKVPALQTTGVDFVTFWQLQNVLDVRYIYSNNIHAVLNTYGVEAARETIIREIMNVFKSYGISVNIRHLTLIADFMTHSGGYRPMNRMGGIAESISPFCKMSFETAAKFIVEAAFHAEVDNLETPSARICLGLPVKMGTGCFDLMQKVEI